MSMDSNVVMTLVLDSGDVLEVTNIAHLHFDMSDGYYSYRLEVKGRVPLYITPWREVEFTSKGDCPCPFAGSTNPPYRLGKLTEEDKKRLDVIGEMLPDTMDAPCRYHGG